MSNCFKKLRRLGLLLALVAPGVFPAGLRAEPVKTHPRLLFTAADLPELRSRMNANNDIWVIFQQEIAQKCLTQWKCSSTSEYRLIPDNDPAPPDYSYMGWVRTSFTDENGVLHKESDADWTSGGWSYQADHPAVPEDDIGDPTGIIRMYTEQYAMIFAFMARMLDGQPGQKALHDEYLAAAKGCLFTVIDQAQLGVANLPWRQGNFATNDRSFAAESFPLAVDWIYEDLTPVERAKVRKAFLIWSEQCNAHVYFAPRRVNGQHGPANSPALLLLDQPEEAARHSQIRLALNNHWANHLRQMVLYSLALDPADDVPSSEVPGTAGVVDDPSPAGALTSQIVGSGGANDWVPIDTGVLRDVTGVWLYLTDYAYRHDGAGALSMEGSEYASNGLGPVALALAALQSAGQDDPQVWGPQVSLKDHPLWSRQIPAYLSLLTPTSRVPSDPNYSYLGQIFQPPLYGDLETYAYINDQFIKVLGPVALADARTNGTNGAVVQAVRYIQRHLAQGGDARLSDRIRNGISSKALRDSLYYFLVFDPVDAADPSAPPPAPDPRPALQPKTFYSAHTVNGREMGTVLARSGYTPADTCFHFRNDWNAIDHQRGDSLSFGLWKNGLWLTKVMTGYGTIQGCSDYRNSLSLQNGVPSSAPVGEDIIAAHGGQWSYSPHIDPAIPARSLADGFLYFTADATALYNHHQQTQLREIEHASRSIVWLKPDRVVVYDRARSKQAGFFKRFFLNLPDTQAATTVTGTVVHSTAKEGATPKAELFVTALLPAGATPQLTDISSGQPAGGEDMKCRMFTEAPGAPQETRFLHVVEGAAAGAATPVSAQLVASADGAFEGAMTGDTCVLFRKDLADPATAGLSLVVPAGATKFYLTGLAPSTGYDVTLTGGTLTVAPGTQRYTDGGGVLVIGAAEPPSIEVTATTPAGAEQGGAPVAFTFTRSGDVAAALTLDLAYSGTADAAADLVAAPATVSFAAGSPAATLVLTPFDDAAYEGEETIVVSAAPSAAYHLSEAAASATATIADNDAPPGGTLQFSVAAFSATEGSAPAAVTLTRTGGTSGAVSVRVTTGNGTATAGADYTATSVVVSWPAGDATPQTVLIPLLNDSTYEGEETIALTLSQVTGVAALGEPAAATLTLQDDDPAPPGVLALSPVTLTVAENTPSVTFTVTRSGGTGGAASVAYATMNGSATAPADYAAGSGVLTWAAGEAGPRTVTITLADDTLYEGDSEAFTFALSGATGAPISGSATATVTLTENDPAPAEFHVGPGQAYAEPSDVPWPVVGAGSTVYLHYRAAPYTRKIILSNRGTAAGPIRLLGVPGENGERPVLDGDGATPPTNVVYPAYTGIEDASLLAITRDQAKAPTFKPGYIEVAGLEIRGAHPTKSYVRQADGVADAYSSYGAGVYVAGADHVVIRDCVIHHCAQGLITSLGGSSEEGLVRDLLIEACHFHDNGEAGQYWGRNLITQGVGVTLRYCRIDPTLSGTNVECINDRSAGFSAIANWIEGGGSQLNFERPYSAPLITGDPSFGQVLVAGNVLRSLADGGYNMIHFGGGEAGAGGKLTVVSNTFHARNGYSRTLVNLHAAGDTAELHHNVFRADAVTEFILAAGPGAANVGRNLASPSYLVGTAAVPTPLITSAASPFADGLAGDYHLAAASAAIDAATGPLPPGMSAAPAVQFVAPFGAVARPVSGIAPDLGAFERGADESRYARWCFGWFGDDLAAGAGAADPDADGASNLLEYLRDLDPLTPSPGVQPAVSLAEGHLVLSLSRDPAATDVGCTVEVSSDLTTWLSGAPHTTVLTDTLAQLEVRDNLPGPGSAPRFIRLRLDH